MNIAAAKTALLLLLSGCLLPVHASTPSSREWNFEVFLDGKPIGFHSFNLTTSGDTHELQGDARFRVKVLGLTVFNYSHRNVELWQDDCLQRIEASTDNNGRDLFVNGSSDGDSLLVRSGDSSSRLPGCVMTFAYWNPEILDQSRLLNAQTGEYLEVSIERLGEQTLQDQETTALHYRIRSNESDIDLWYSNDQDWLALSTITSGGRELRYRRITATSESADDSGE